MAEAFKQHCTAVKVEKGKKTSYKCNFCSEVFSGTTRIIVHLSGIKGKKGAEAAACKKVSPEVRRAALLHLDDGQKRPLEEDEDDEVQDVSGQQAPSKRRSSAGAVQEQRRGSSASGFGSSSGTQTPITSYTQVLKHTEAQDAISSFLYECGISFNVTRHPSWFEMWEAVRKAGPGLRPLSYNTLRTTQLKKVHFIFAASSCSACMMLAWCLHASFVIAQNIFVR